MKKLNKKQAMIVSRILEDVNFKYYVDTLLSQRIDRILSMCNNKDEKIMMLLVDISSFIIQNMNKAEESIDALIMSYKKISQEEVDEMDIDVFTSTLKELIIGGVPSVVNDFVDLTEVKKKLQDLKV